MADWLGEVNDENMNNEEVKSALLNASQQRVFKELERMAAEEEVEPKIQNNGIREDVTIEKGPMTQQSMNDFLRALQPQSNIL